MEAVQLVRPGQVTAGVASALGLPMASLSNWEAEISASKKGEVKKGARLGVKDWTGDTNVLKVPPASSTDSGRTLACLAAFYCQAFLRFSG